MSICKVLLDALAVVTVAAVTSSPLGAAVYYWDPNRTSGTNLGGEGTWNTSAANWWNGSTDTDWANGSDACFTSLIMTNDPQYSPTLAQAVTAGNLSFDGAVPYQLSGSTLTLSGGTINVIQDGMPRLVRASRAPTA
ncbi:MAG: hypothetical protein ACLP9L_09800 [Thermoguttaceae bacterium]